MGLLWWRNSFKATLKVHNIIKNHADATFTPRVVESSELVFRVNDIDAAHETLLLFQSYSSSRKNCRKIPFKKENLKFRCSKCQISDL